MNDIICETCGHVMQWGEFPFCPHALTGRAAMAQKSGIFPFTTPHIRGDGQPMVIQDIAHLRRVEKEYGVVLPAFAQNEHDLDPIKNPPVYRGYELAGDTYMAPDKDRAAFEANRKRNR